MSKLQLVSLAFLLTTSACQSTSVPVASDSSTTPAGAVERDTPRKYFAGLGTYELVGPPLHRVIESGALMRMSGALGQLENVTGGDIIAVEVRMRSWDFDLDIPRADGSRPMAASVSFAGRTFQLEPSAEGARVRLDGFVLGPGELGVLRFDDVQPGGAAFVAFEVEPIFARAR